MQMTELAAEQRLVKFLVLDTARYAVLQAVAEFNLPDAYVAAGFLRNLAWDHCHGFENTPLNDVDIIYFEASDTTPEATERHIQTRLTEAFPNLDWDVKNQARMHLRNKHAPYKNTTDAMTFWPEMETAVGVALVDGEFCFAAPFGLKRLFELSVTYNPKRARSLFEQRVASKHWPDIWPRLKTVYPNA